MRTRVIASIIIAAFLIAALILGKAAVTVLAVIVCSFAMCEYLMCFYSQKEKITDIILSLMIGNFILICIAYFNSASALAISLSFMLIFIYNILRRRYEAGNVILQIFSIIYIPIPLGLAVDLFSLQNGNILIWLVFIIACSNDTVAYFIGISKGKRKLCPAISPKKSIEGAIAGFIGGITASVICGIIFVRYFNISNPVWHYILIGALAGIFAQFGDLSASLIKRNFSKKDFSSLIPGHGGILDRIDSILFVIPVIYFYAFLA